MDFVQRINKLDMFPSWGEGKETPTLELTSITRAVSKGHNRVHACFLSPEVDENISRWGDEKPTLLGLLDRANLIRWKRFSDWRLFFLSFF
jgi:hypothetical protein